TADGGGGGVRKRGAALPADRGDAGEPRASRVRDCDRALSRGLSRGGAGRNVGVSGNGFPAGRPVLSEGHGAGKRGRLFDETRRLVRDFRRSGVLVQAARGASGGSGGSDSAAERTTASAMAKTDAGVGGAVWRGGARIHVFFFALPQ